MSKIEWTEQTWNPIVGCSVVSPGCTNCYAMRMAGHRLDGNPKVPHYAGTTQASNAGPVWTGQVALAPERVLTEPLRRRKPTVYFVNSMGDLFHENVPDEWIDRVFAVMALTPQHTYQVLTKRADRMRAYMNRDQDDIRDRWYRAVPAGKWPVSVQEAYAAIHPHSSQEMRAIWRRQAPIWPMSNVWLGVSAEDQTRADARIPDLLATPAAIRFVSAEPLLGPLNLDDLIVDDGQPGEWHVNALDAEGGDPADDPDFGCNTLDWVICGGESGPGARPMHPDWARSLRDQCAAAGVPFFFKQWGEWAPGDAFGLQSDGPVHDRYGNVRDWMRRYVVCADRADRLTAHSFDGHATNLVYQVGKKRAGRLLDGVEHNGMPDMRRAVLAHWHEAMSTGSPNCQPEKD